MSSSRVLADTDAAFVGPERDWAEGADPILRTLVDWANGPGQFEAGVTLHVGGMMVSGTLVGIDAWIEWVRDTFAENMPNKAVRESYVQYWEAVRKELQDDLQQSEAHPERHSPPSFVHIKDAQFFVWGPNQPMVRHPFWRGRLEQVDGFVLGTLMLRSEQTKKLPAEPKRRRKAAGSADAG